MRRSKSLVLAAVLAALSAPSTMAAAQAASSPAAERFVVSGVVLLEGNDGLAWLQEPTLTGNRAVALRPGQNVGPYRLTGVFEDRVELDGPNGKVRIPIHVAGSETVVAATGAPQERSLRFPPGGMTAEGTANPAVPQVGTQATSEAEGVWRDQAEIWKRQAEGQQETTTAEAPAGSAVPKPAPANPFANNPSVKYIPMNDPRRLSPFGSMLGGS